MKKFGETFREYRHTVTPGGKRSILLVALAVLCTLPAGTLADPQVFWMLWVRPMWWLRTLRASSLDVNNIVLRCHHLAALAAPSPLRSPMETRKHGDRQYRRNYNNTIFSGEMGE